ncbi:hypothetical protein, partial [Escherichia coli]
MLSPIRTTFHNSVNIVQSSPCQTVVWVHHILQFLFSFKIYSTG